MDSPGSGATYWVKDGAIGGNQIQNGINARSTDASATTSLNAFAGRTVRLSAAITAARTVPEPVGVPIGTEILYVRASTATGASNWNIGSDALTTPGTWLRKKLLGTNWTAIARGTT